MKPRVFLTRRWPEAVEQALAEHFNVELNLNDKPMSSSQLCSALQEYDAICPCVADSITAEMLTKQAIKTRLIANYGVGYNNIDIQAAKAHNISVSNTPDVLTHATADLAMTILLMLARRAGEAERHVRTNQWQGWYPTHMMGSMVTGKTLGLIGMGKIGQAMARKAHFGFNMPIIYHNRRALSSTELSFDADYCSDLSDLLKQADFVSIHCPSSTDTFHLLNSDTLNQMKKSAFLINTARGDVVEESALITALQTGKIAGAGLDVFEQEPKVPEALKQMENVVLLPHLGSATLETRTAMGMRVLQNLLTFFDSGEPLDKVV